MHSQPRYFVISAPRFDATTPLDPVALLPKGVNPGGNSFPIPSQNQPRLSATLTAPVGRFSIRSLLRPGNLGALVRVRCITPPEPGAYWQFRSAAVGEQVDPPPIDQVLSPPKALTQEWSEIFLAGTTDAIVVFHNPDVQVNPQIEIEVSEFSGELATAYLAAKAEPCGCDATCTAANRDEVLGAEQSLTLTPWECLLHLNVTATDPGTVVTLPLANAMASGAAVLISRRGGAWIRVVAPDGINGVAAPAGLVFESAAKAVLLQPTATGWSATDVVPDLEPVIVAASPLAPFSGDAVRNIELPASNVLVLPATGAIAEGQTLYLTNTSSSEVTVQLAAPLTENFDGIVGLEYVLANRGDTLVLKRDGGTGWRTSYNLFGRYARIDTAPDSPLNVPAYRGRRSYRFDDVDVSINLPTDAFVGQQVHLVNVSGDLTIQTSAPQIIVGAGVNSNIVLMQHPNVWGYFEYEGSNIWSYHECCEPSQDRQSLAVTEQNTPQDISAPSRDVTIYAVKSTAVTNEIRLPPINYPGDANKVLKLVNIGQFSVQVTASPGTLINGVPTVILNPTMGIELQAWDSALWALT